jgi:hypothetical protein
MPRQTKRGGRGIVPIHLQPALEGCGWSAPCSSRFTHAKDPVPIVQKARWALEPGWTAWKVSPSMGFDPKMVQAATSHYTNYAIPAPTHQSRKPKISVFHSLPFHYAKQNNFLGKFITCQTVFNPLKTKCICFI